MSNYDRPKGFSMEEAEALCKEHEQTDCVLDASPVTFAGITHVHLDMKNGDIVVFGAEESYHIEI